mgnify:CR=1 FL=1
MLTATVLLIKMTNVLTKLVLLQTTDALGLILMVMVFLMVPKC